MIEPTDEMTDAAYAACEESLTEVEAADMRRIVAAVLAIVARDYVLSGRTVRSGPEKIMDPEQPQLCACPKALCYSAEARALDLRCAADGAR